MKPYETYQRLDKPLTKRDKEELGSNFWNEGKFNNYVLPLLKLTSKQTLIDMGCNAGLHLKMAEELGFEAIGVDSNKEAVERGKRWRDENGYHYKFILSNMEDAKVPVSDYTLFINSHYYFKEEDFIEYIKNLNTRYCIIVTAEKNHLKEDVAKADIESIRGYFKDWEEVGMIDTLPLKGKHSRKMQSICFKSGIDKVSVDSLDNGNAQQRDFLKQLDEHGDPFKTDYYRRLKDYRSKTTSRQEMWSDERLKKYMLERVKLYEDIKKNGPQEPIIVKGIRITDGNHRHDIIRHLGFKDIYIRRV